MQKVRAQLSKDAAEWRSSFLGEDYKLQPKGRERGLEHPGSLATMPQLSMAVASM